ncbi:MAG TPA: VOC family protein [Myxococcaceae bacterium]|nr:VOC family protein [Myxococcaceae bacterium]
MTSLRACIDVDDLDRGTEFYTRALGLKSGRRVAGIWVELLGASSPIDLLAKPSGSPACAGKPPLREYRRHWTPVHLDFVVEHLDAAVRRAQEAGALLERGIEEHKWGRIANMADPFGHGFCLIEFRGRGYDEVVGG